MVWNNDYGRLTYKAAGALAALHVLASAIVGTIVIIGGTHVGTTPEGETTAVRPVPLMVVTAVFPILSVGVLWSILKREITAGWIFLACYWGLGFLFGFTIGPIFLATGGVLGLIALTFASLERRRKHSSGSTDLGTQ